METKELAVSNSKPHQTMEVYIPTEVDWNFMVKWGQQAVKTRMLPSSISTPEAAAIIVLKGRELGLSFMTSIAHIHVINGKPSMSAELIQGLARKNLPGLVINIIESDDKVAKIEFIRPEKGAKPYVQTFTMDQAVAAKLTAKDVWKQYPAAMLWSRAVTAGLRKVCPEALMGVSYTAEELGANVDVEGNIIETTSRQMIEPVKEPKEQRPNFESPYPQPEPIVLRPTKEQLKSLFDYVKAHNELEVIQHHLTLLGLKGSHELSLDQFKEIDEIIRGTIGDPPEEEAPWLKEAGPL